MKITKEQLQKENTNLNMELAIMKSEDLKMRTTLSELLESYDIYKDTWSGSSSKKVNVLDWVGIAFCMGELKADADFAMAIEREKRLRGEIDMLQQKLYKLENPEIK